MVSKVFFYVMFALSMALTALLGWSVAQTNLIALQMVLIGVAVLALIPMLMFALQKDKKGENKKGGFRVVSIVILLFLSLVEGAVCFYIQKYNTKMDEVTEVRSQYTQVQVYVKEENRAQTIEYAVESEFRFGTLADTDADAIAQARQEIEKRYGRTVQIQGYHTLLDLVRALDEDQIDALLISSAYVDLIDSLEGYEDFGSKLRSLHTSMVQTEIMPQPIPQNPEITEELAQTLQDPDLWKNSFCAYISGIDTFGPVTTRSRSDVNILAIVNQDTKTVLLISTPRDYYVPFNFRPASGAMDKLTHAGIYGIEGSMQALGDYYGFPIQYYMRVNFTGFIDVIDTLGGVDVESDADFGRNGYYFQKGMNHLDGRAALRFVRDRHSFGEGDRARGRHQMAVIKGVIESAKSSKIITNYSELMDEMAGCFQTNASKALVGRLVQLTMDRSKGDWTVLTYSVDGESDEDFAYSLGCYAYVMVPYPETVDYARTLAIAIASGETMTQEQLQQNAPKP